MQRSANALALNAQRCLFRSTHTCLPISATRYTFHSSSVIAGRIQGSGPSPSSSRSSHSVAQPSGPAAYEDVPAPPYISPAKPNTNSQSSSQPASSSSSIRSSSQTSPSSQASSSSSLTPQSTSASTSASTTDGTKPAPRRSAIRSQKSAIKMTPSAIEHLRSLISSPTDPKLLRIGVKTRGCAGMAYHLDYVPPPGGKFDEVVEQDGVKVLIDSKALFSIIGSTMDWRDNRLSAGFVFDNPNVVDSCGCGESFNVR